MREIKIVSKILKSNEDLAQNNRNLFKEKGTFVINLMSSPGAGKTSILEKLIIQLQHDLNIGVIEGDLYTTKDAQRIEALGVEVVQINTEGACHLDSQMIKLGFEKLENKNIDLLIIENVGNLVCPAEFEIGEDVKIGVISVPEGNDKPLKYPIMFEKATAVVLNKMDLIPYTNFNLSEFYEDIKKINSNLHVFETSTISESGIDSLCKYIKSLITRTKGGD